ncbi:MAG TPA: cysteine--tRNA ligase, partial [Patescibacteria group bacterium]|nr:cysteine--tRNA ligase [Patescibacteria group bacterium]
ATLLKFDEVLGLNLSNPPRVEEAKLPEKVKKLAARREAAREEKNFKKSDELREEIGSLGFEVMDTPEGQKVKKKMPA